MDLGRLESRRDGGQGPTPLGDLVSLVARPGAQGYASDDQLAQSVRAGGGSNLNERRRLLEGGEGEDDSAARNERGDPAGLPTA